MSRTIVEPERVLRAWKALTFDASCDDPSEYIDLDTVFSTGESKVEDGVLVTTFFDEGVHKLRVPVGLPFWGNGFSARLEVTGFEALDGLLFGFELDGTLRRITVQNLWEERWVDVSFGLSDLIFGLQNGWPKLASGQITELHLHFTGRAKHGLGRVALKGLEVWDAEENDFNLQIGGQPTTFSALREQPGFAAALTTIPGDLMAALDVYIDRLNPDADAQADAFLTRGNSPSFRTTLPWPFDACLPPDLATVNSYRWAWHSLHAVPILLRRARRTGEVAPIYAARDFVTCWLERSYYQVDPDSKYCWYDQGVGDRLLALVLMWDQGLRIGFDQRFMTRLLEAISRHMQLVGGEPFYASHQDTRYHNHAVFQDLAVMVASLSVPQLTGARRYFELAVARVTDQVERLLTEDGDCAVLIENSLSYHVGFQWLMDFADSLVRLGKIESSIVKLASAMRRFIELATYPDGRLPGIGDSPRIANSAARAPTEDLPKALPEFTLLPRAGHMFVRGNHDGRAFMLTLSATSLAETHKHEDNLSFTLFYDGIEWLIDPSFHSYEPSQPVAGYLRKAVAHNTVVLDGLPYSLAAGVARLHGTRDAEGFLFEGQHDAYGVARIERVLQGRFDALTLRVVDRVLPRKVDFVATAHLMFHCGEGVAASLEGARLTLRHPSSPFELRLRLPSSRTRAYHGDFHAGEPRGFTGLGFMEQAPITTIECALTPGADASWDLVTTRST